MAALRLAKEQQLKMTLLADTFAFMWNVPEVKIKLNNFLHEQHKVSVERKASL